MGLIEHATKPGFRNVNEGGQEMLVYPWMDHVGWLILLPVAFALAAAMPIYVWVRWSENLPGPVLALLLVPMLGTLYATAQRCWNRTTVLATRAEVIVRRGPVPWPRTFRIPRDAVESLGIRRVIRNQRDADDHGEHTEQKSYRVQILRSDGRPVWLIKHLSSFRSALSAKRAVAEYLGLDAEA